MTGTLPPFFRVDGRIEKRWTFSGGQWIGATFECFNALGKAEQIGADYSPAAGLTPRIQAPIIFPSFGLEGALSPRWHPLQVDVTAHTTTVGQGCRTPRARQELFTNRDRRSFATGTRTPDVCGPSALPTSRRVSPASRSSSNTRL